MTRARQVANFDPALFAADEVSGDKVSGGTIGAGTWEGTDVAVAHGGTGASTHTANNVLIGAGTSALTSIAPGADGQVLTSTGSVWNSEAAAGGVDGIVSSADATVMTINDNEDITMGDGGFVHAWGTGYAVLGIHTDVQNRLPFSIDSNDGSTNHPLIEGWTSDEIVFQLEVTGDIQIDGSVSSPASDYAEYFESTDGNAIEHGVSVVLDNGKVRPATDGEQPIGIVRPYDAPTIIGGANPLKWGNKLMLDDYGGKLYETYSNIDWDDETGQHHSYNVDRVPSDITPPEDAIITSTKPEPDGRKFYRPVLNPDFDPELEYVQRENRDEWNLIGILGQIPITKGQPVAESWVKMNDVSETVEMWFVK